jgi:probable rRNA maturation factor
MANSKRSAANRVLLDAARGGRGAKSHGVRLAAQAKRFLAALGLSGTELSLVLVGDAEIRALNRTWRQKDRPTDVLSFPAGDQPGPGPRLLGDVIISLDTARRQASEFESALALELSRYLAHGILHVLGFDHHRLAEKHRMEAEEHRLLGQEGMLARAMEGGRPAPSRGRSAGPTASHHASEERPMPQRRQTRGR